jgi:ABC-type amino acid transport substrate-binding protein
MSPLHACAVPGDELVTPGALTACIARIGAPAADLTPEGDFDGYNVAFAREKASRMGLTVEAALADMVADGTYGEILVEYLPNEESVEIVSIID